MSFFDFISTAHISTRRDYLARVLAGNKAEFSKIAKRFDKDYWDGSRNTGYGGYNYDGRWKPIARLIGEHYKLNSGQRVLDIGCGKGDLLFDLRGEFSGIEIFGLDVSEYAIKNSVIGVRDRLKVGSATQLPFPDDYFDLVLGINVLHNLRLPELAVAFQEIERVGKANKYIVMDSYRTEQEKVNLMYWQLTCECFFTQEEWEWLFRQCGYTGDYGLVFFE